MTITVLVNLCKKEHIEHLFVTPCTHTTPSPNTINQKRWIDQKRLWKVYFTFSYVGEIQLIVLQEKRKLKNNTFL